LAALPKIIYGSIKVGTVMYDGQEVFHIIEQLPDNEVRHIYHKHQGDPEHNGGCYTIEKNKTETRTVTHAWSIIGLVRTENFEGEVVAGEGTSHIISEIYSVRDEHGHTGEMSWCMMATGARAAMEHSWEFTSDAYGNASGKSDPAPREFETSKTSPVKVTYYDLGCGFDGT